MDFYIRTHYFVVRSLQNTNICDVQPVARKRGRPRKYPLANSTVTAVPAVTALSTVSTTEKANTGAIETPASITKVKYVCSV